MIKKLVVLFCIMIVSLSSVSFNYISTEDYTKKLTDAGKEPITPIEYQKYLGKGLDVDWSKTTDGKKYYNEQTVIDFKNRGIKHVRIRVKDPANEDLFRYLDKQIDDCIANGVIPIIAYQADEFKNNPTQENVEEVVKWWSTVAERYKNKSYLLSFNLIIEPTDSLNGKPEVLNNIYEQVVTEIRKTNPNRIIMIAPMYRSNPTYLKDLKIPSQHNNYLMAEWHFYAAGPDKTNVNKLWTTGTPYEKQLIQDKIDIALQWQNETGIPTWVGAWMPSNYNDGDSYTMREQIVFSNYLTNALESVGIPYAVNSDTKFYDRTTNTWYEDKEMLLNVIFN